MRIKKSTNFYKSNQKRNKYYCYAITNTRTKQIYVGATNDIERRSLEHCSRLEVQTHHNRLIQEEYNSNRSKYLVLEVLAVTSTEAEAKELEAQLIKSGIATYNLLNAKPKKKLHIFKSLQVGYRHHEKIENKYINEEYSKK